VKFKCSEDWQKNTEKVSNECLACGSLLRKKMQAVKFGTGSVNCSKLSKKIKNNLSE
jgi:hypothetical protein